MSKDITNFLVYVERHVVEYNYISSPCVILLDILVRNMEEIEKSASTGKPLIICYILRTLDMRSAAIEYSWAQNDILYDIDSLEPLETYLRLFLRFSPMDVSS